MPVSSEVWRAGELGTQNLYWTPSSRRRLLTLEPTQSVQVLVFTLQIPACYSV